jgi:ABC-type ATPase involved in cell division
MVGLSRRDEVAAAGASLVALEGVTKTYADGKVEVRALVDVTLELAPGEVTVILGPSGSGKTTLLNLIGALDSPSSGLIVVAGTELTGLSEAGLTRFRREEVGFVFQYFNLLPSLTARENVMLAAEILLAEGAADYHGLEPGDTLRLKDGRGVDGAFESAGSRRRSSWPEGSVYEPAPTPPGVGYRG